MPAFNMYHFSLPPDEIVHLVNRFFEIEVPGASTFDENRVIPQGMGTISFILKGNPRVECINGIQTIPDYMLSGQYFPACAFDHTEHLMLYGISLKPTSAFKLFNIHIAELKNGFINLEEVIGDEAGQIYSRLKEAPSSLDRFKLMGDFIKSRLPVTTKYDPLDVLIDLIYQRKGIIKVSELCDSANVSRRYLEKRFKKMIGFTPGKFIRQVRFNFACSNIAEGKKPVNDILKDYNYYDRSHFMKEFKKHHFNDLSIFSCDGDTLLKTIYSRISHSF